MKLTILGGGGFRVPLVHEAVATAATGLTVDEVALHDVDPARLRTITAVIEGLAERLRAEGHGATLPRLTATADLREAATGADFVFSAVRVGGAEARTVDERVALGLGLLGQETIGPGGLAYALRTIPVALEIARMVAEVAPSAWVINFTNPAGIVTEAMRTVLGDRAVGICDTPIGLVRRVGRLLGTDLVAGEGGASFDYVGLNHLGWLRSVTIDGVDRLPGLLADAAALEEIEEARLIGKDWVRADGALPNEYLFYYLHTADAIERITGAATTRGEFLAKQQGDFYLAAAEADGRGPEARAAESCCTSPLGLWRETLHEREATYMAESRDEERREEESPGAHQEVAMRLMTALATGSPERMIWTSAHRRRPRGGLRAADRAEGPRACSRCCAGGRRRDPPLPVAPVELGGSG